MGNEVCEMEDLTEKLDGVLGSKMVLWEVPL